MDNEKRIVKIGDSELEISVVISFKYDKNNKNYIVYKVENTDGVLISSFNVVDNELVLEEISEEESNEINTVLKEIVSGGNN